MRVVAILTCYNESRFIGHVLQHYLDHGIEVYILDNESGDDSVEIARQYLNDNLIAIETVPNRGKDWLGMLRRKEMLAAELGADWYIHADPDEFRLPPSSDQTLHEAIESVDREGYTAINFMEYTFVPTAEQPDHDNDRFLETMTSYYPYLPKAHHRQNAWKQPRHWKSPATYLASAWRQRTVSPRRAKLTGGGHRVSFDGLRLWPTDFKMRHYIVLSLEHAVRKYVGIDYAHARNTGNWRGWANENMFRVPQRSELRSYTTDDELDPSNPRTQHIFLDREQAYAETGTG